MKPEMNFRKSGPMYPALGIQKWRCQKFKTIFESLGLSEFPRATYEACENAISETQISLLLVLYFTI